MGTFGLLVFALVLPNQANQLAQKVLGETVTISTHNSISSPSNAVSQLISSLISPSSDGKSSSGSGASTAALGDTTGPLSVVNIIDATNAERVKAGLPPLKTNAKLAQSAKAKTDDMVNNHYFEHTSPSGKTVADLGQAAGYDYVVMGENLAVGDFSNANDLLTAWMNSPGHRANILNTSYQEIGAYAEQGTYQGRTVWFAVQHFGTARGVCPAISTALKSSITSSNASIRSQEAAITVLRTQIEDPSHPQGQAYSNMISQFNVLVAKYNADLTASQEKISAYNKQIVAFNKCLAQYQVSSPAE